MAWRARHRILPAGIVLLVLIISIAGLLFILKPDDPQAAVVGLETLSKGEIACLEEINLEIGELKMLRLGSEEFEVGVIEIREVGLVSNVQLWVNNQVKNLAVGGKVSLGDRRDLIYLGTNQNDKIGKTEANLCLTPAS